MDSRCPIGGSALAVNRFDFLYENSIESAPLRRRTAPPGVVARARYAEHPTQPRDRVPCLLCLDEPKDAHRVPSSLAKKAAVDSTGQCNTVGFLVLSGSEVWVWLIWVVRGCRQHARRSFGIGGRPESPLATSPGRCRRLPALFTGYSKPPAESLHPADVGQGGYSLWLSGRRSPADLRPESRCALSRFDWPGLFRL